MFDRALEYEAQLARGLALSGEGKAYFQRGRIRDLVRCLPEGFAPRQILDFGCGLGDTTQLLAEAFPGAQVVGTDTAEGALDYAREHFGSDRIRFAALGALDGPRRFDLAYANGVFHHIPRPERRAAARSVGQALVPGGRFALFENSPFNPGTRLVMSRIPFDRDADLLTPGAARRLLSEVGFACPEPARFLFIFPRALRLLRRLEPRLSRWPLGGQFWLLATWRGSGTAASDGAPAGSIGRW
jgi:SAM-dependent methyltransferase